MTEPTPDPDALDWDVATHGRMAEHASDDEPPTEPYEPDEDEG